jgi:hypothetical protein
MATEAAGRNGNRFVRGKKKTNLTLTGLLMEGVRTPLRNF